MRHRKCLHYDRRGRFTRKFVLLRQLFAKSRLDPRSRLELGRFLVELNAEIGHGKWRIWLEGHWPELGGNVTLAVAWHSSNRTRSLRVQIGGIPPVWSGTPTQSANSWGAMFLRRSGRSWKATNEFLVSGLICLSPTTSQTFGDRWAMATSRIYRVGPYGASSSRHVET
jgi:hypothetical protein